MRSWAKFCEAAQGAPRDPRRDSTVSDSDIRVPAELGQERQVTSFLSNGTPLASRVVHGVSGPLSNCVCEGVMEVMSDAVKSNIA